MKLYFVIFLSLILSSCSLAQTEWKVIDFGEFTVELPEESKDEQLSSIDSYVSKIVIDSTEFMFDYGFYSPKMTLSVEKYFYEEEWRQLSGLSFLYFDNERPIFLKRDSISKYVYRLHFDISGWIENDTSFYNRYPEFYEGKCEFDSNIMSVVITIPEKIQKTDFYISETDSTFKRIFIPFKGEDRKSGIYMIDFSDCKQRSWCSKQLSFWIEKRGNLSDEEILRVYRSLKFKN